MSRRRAVLVADLAFGDCGKGTIVDFLTGSNEADLIVRYNGGPQAGHNIVRPDGRHHTFSQFGSGLFHPSTRSLLAEPVLIDPYAFFNEAAHLAAIGIPDAVGRTIIDARCRVITPPQQVANRIRERSRGSAAHGTCGMGVGETVADSITRPDLVLHADELADRSRVRQKLADLLARKRADVATLIDHATADERRVLEDDGWIDVAVDLYETFARQATILPPEDIYETVAGARSSIFEGAQGVLLDEHYGFHPHTTWADTTFTAANALLAAAGGCDQLTRLGVMRTYATRHGAGPFVTESSRLTRDLAEPHNSSSGPQGQFRCGVLDLTALRYAVAALGDGVELAVTHLDRLPDLPAIACDGYQDADGRPIHLAAPGQALQLADARPVYRNWPVSSELEWIAATEQALGRPVRLLSRGPTAHDKSWR
ncbi:MAG: adenylosuccinate synthase [Phycisphaerales bacterium]|nr:adenylosuccinate synthase [Phycisphaerales bacterium]